MNKILMFFESINFGSKMIFYLMIWATCIHYLSTTPFIEANVWLTITGIVCGLSFLFLPHIREKYNAQKKSIAQEGSKEWRK